jgi:hypothetical protein
MVGRLVEQQRLGAGEQNPGQLNPAPLAAGQRAQRLAEHPIRQAEAGRDLRRLGLGRVPTPGQELRLQPGVAPHGPIMDFRVGTGHRALGRTQFGHDLVQPAGGQHPVPGQQVQIAGARILRQVADGSGPRHPPADRLTLPGQHPGQRRLAGAIAADQTDPIGGRDPERGRPEQSAGAGAQLETGCGDHVWTAPGLGSGGQRTSPHGSLCRGSARPQTANITRPVYGAVPTVFAGTNGGQHA